MKFRALLQLHGKTATGMKSRNTIEVSLELIPLLAKLRHPETWQRRIEKAVPLFRKSRS